MVEVTRLDGKMYYVNPHQIEYIERNPDTTLTMLSGKKLVVREDYQTVFHASSRTAGSSGPSRTRNDAGHGAPLLRRNVFL